MTLAATLACLSFGLVAYSYLGYPIVLSIVAGVAARRRRRAAPMTPASSPRVAVVVAAHNEQKHIAERLDNLFSQDYPSELLTVYVGDDGSRDETGAILDSYVHDRLRVIHSPVNRGKAATLNLLLEQVDAPIVVFTDANTHFHPEAIRELVKPFADPQTGAVCGELRLKAVAGDNPDSVYWRLEQGLKIREARIGALLGANGGIYAIRRALWQPIAMDTICDDFTIAMNVAAAGFRVDYEPAAQAEEEAAAAIADEFQRRVRIGIGNFQSLFRQPRYFTATNWATRFAYLSHKVLRWVGPHLLLVALVASALAARSSAAWAWLTAFQLAGYGAALLLFLVTRRASGGTRLPGPLRAIAFLSALNFAFLIASLRFTAGRYRPAWQRTAR